MTTPPPSNPMAVARILLLSWINKGRPNLLHWRGQWMLWQGTHWRELDAAEVRSVAYKELEHAIFEFETPKGETKKAPWAPTKKKIADLMEAMAAIRILPPAVDAAVYRIVQESVTNAMRHAVDATEVVVRITGEPHTVRVTVQDDGTRPGRGRDGYGLAGLRERAALRGGELNAGPGTDQGWLVEAELPRGRANNGVHPRARR